MPKATPTLCPTCDAPQSVVDSRKKSTRGSLTWELAHALVKPLISQGVVPPILVARVRRCENGHDEITVEVSLGVQGG